VDTIPVRVFWKDTDSRYLGCNQPFAEDAGQATPDDLIGKDDYAFPWGADQADAYRRDDQAVMVSGQARLNYEELQTTPDGRTIWLQTSKVPMRDAQENIIGVLGTYQDVTERIRLEEMMIQSEKMLSVGGLAAGMAHEINNPLAGIMQNAAVLASRLSADLPANLKAAEAAGTSMAAIRHYMTLRQLDRMLDNIRTSGERAAAIVRNMLSFARKSDHTVSSHDLRVLMDESVELAQTDYDMKKHYDFKQIQIVRQYAETVDPVPCEKSKIQQVFLNILKNGAEAMTDNLAATAVARFTLKIEDDGLWVRVDIADNGPGMEENTRRRVFEPFFTTKPAGKGTGLGLSVSYFIITENHSGKMDVFSTTGKGTRFVIRLPKSAGGVTRTC
jgi:PAS domain S-box-containing protein